MREEGSRTLCIIYGMDESGLYSKGKKTNQSLPLPHIHKKEPGPNLPRRKSSLRKQMMQHYDPLK